MLKVQIFLHLNNKTLKYLDLDTCLAISTFILYLIELLKSVFENVT